MYRLLPSSPRRLACGLAALLTLCLTPIFAPAAGIEAPAPAPATPVLASHLPAKGKAASPLATQPSAKTSARPKAPHRAPHNSKKPKAAVKRGDAELDLVSYGSRADALALADTLAERHGLDPAWARAQLAQARFVPTVARLIMPAPAGTAKNWAAYRARFIEPDRVRNGVAFWAANAAWLDAAEQRYGVPAAVVVGIIGVETFYGRVTGNFRVLDALATLSLDFPVGRKDRSDFFQAELGQFLRLVMTEQLPPAGVKGSFAGAIGLGQFMPGSINRFAVDFDGNGHIDMADSAADVIGSVAHYLAEHGWQRDQPSHFAVKPPVDSVARATLLLPDILPSFTPTQMTGLGAVLDPAALAHTGPLALVELQNGDAAPSFVAGTQNFYAVTRYNQSSYYALAVIELGQAVAAARAAGR